MKDIREKIDAAAKLLPLNKAISTVDAEKRASEFLMILAHITEERHALNEDKIAQQSTLSAVYSQLLSSCTGKTVTENKVTVEASEQHQSARELLEMTENDLSYLKAYYDIFMAAHVFFRNIAKGEAF